MVRLLDIHYFCTKSVFLFQHITDDPEDYTLKNYYYPINLSDDEETCMEPTNLKAKKNGLKRINNSIEQFFEKPKKKKKSSNFSSSIGQATTDGTAYISSNDEGSSKATHFIKIEIYEIEKIKDVSPNEYWKYANVRVKYCAPSEEDKNYQYIRDVVYNITKQIAAKSDCKKYYIENKKM